MCTRIPTWLANAPTLMNPPLTSRQPAKAQAACLFVIHPSANQVFRAACACPLTRIGSPGLAACLPAQRVSERCFAHWRRFDLSLLELLLSQPNVRLYLLHPSFVPPRTYASLSPLHAPPTPPAPPTQASHTCSLSFASFGPYRTDSHLHCCT